MKFLVVEYQYKNDTMSMLSYGYNNIEDAIEKYHDILSKAVKSNTDKHGAVIFDVYLNIIEKEVFEH